jgi:AraC-like DNA-binding protein
MNKINIILIISFLHIFCIKLAAQENPFMHMANKKYADFSSDFDNYRFSMNFEDTTILKKVVAQLQEVAEKTGSMEWKLIAEFGEIELFEQLYAKEKSEELVKQLFDLIQKAQKNKILSVELRCRNKMIYTYWHYIENYELAFEQCDILDKALQKVSLEEIPEKSEYNLHISNCYHQFKDYPKAISYYEKILSEKDNRVNQKNKKGALNNLGVCYRYWLNDLDRSDSCFLAILKFNALNLNDGWDGIAEGNLGYNMILRKKYDEALPLLESSMKKMLEQNDYGYLAGVAKNLAVIYLHKDNLPETKRYIDLAKNFYARDPRTGVLPSIFETMSKYYAATGNSKLAMTYIDSTRLENEKLEEEFNALLLMRVEQRKHLSEQQAKDEQLSLEKVKNVGYKRSLGIAVTGLLFVGGILFFTVILYRKKRSAYQELVRKTQEWAHVETKSQNEPDEADALIIKDIVRLLKEEKIFRDASLTVDLLAHQLNAKRHYVSMAINRCTKKNFNTFVNEYRVKEAVQLLSKSNFEQFSIDQIAFDSGFTDRKNFYRVFKKITGLSPTEFRENMEKI